MRKLFWSELTSGEFAALDPQSTIAVLPVAAIEQHGPHLAVSTDTVIAEGMIAEVVKQLPADLSILILPTQAIGKSNEHLRSPGTLTLTAETAIRAWTEIGESVSRAGLRKLVMVNSHGPTFRMLRSQFEVNFCLSLQSKCVL
jgi:creatinine amidohydrolase